MYMCKVKMINNMGTAEWVEHQAARSKVVCLSQAWTGLLATKGSSPLLYMEKVTVTLEVLLVLAASYRNS